MFAKVKSSVFIDALQFELSAPKGHSIRGILKDDEGSVCGTMEKDIAAEIEQFTWTGLSHLPYGRYTLELSQGDGGDDANQMSVNLVKRI